MASMSDIDIIDPAIIETLDESTYAILARLLDVAARTVMDHLRDTGMTESQVGEWLTYHRRESMEMVIALLKHAMTPEFKQALLSGNQ